MECCIHKNQIDFELPEMLCKAILEQRVVLFTGAGISTETNLISNYKFYYTICDLLEVDSDKSNIQFSTLMSSYVNKFSKKELIMRIKERFDNIKSFDKLYYLATRFHNELATIPFINEIITTNWDDFFEVECQALPIVVDKDIAFWDLPVRRVLKMHGSINNVGTIIATESDYDDKYNEYNTSVLGGLIKSILARKIIIFLGYSYNDFDFVRIYDEVISATGDMIDKHIIVTLDDNFDRSKLHKQAIVIKTDATYFIEKIKKQLIDDNYLVSDNIIDNVLCKFDSLKQLHIDTCSLFESSKNANLFYSIVYQDGYLDGIGRMIKHLKTGEYHSIHKVINMATSYDSFVKKPIFKSDYTNLSYLYGYKAFLDDLCLFYLDKSNFKPNFYFLYGYKENIESIDELNNNITQRETYHKKSYIFIKKTAEQMIVSNTLPQFLPIL